MNFSYDVILCAYNGSGYITEQLDSILNQKYVPSSIIISDDGSQDGTMSVISDYIREHHNIDFVIVEGPRCGPSNNFISALQYVSSPYVFLSDQDDVWCPNKIERYKESILNNAKKKPQLFFSDSKIVDKDLSDLGESHMETLSYSPNKFMNNEILFFNYIQGATVCINRSFIFLFNDLVSKYSLSDIVIYDWWFGIIANYFGEIHYINEELILYRQHDENLVGVDKEEKFLKKIVNSIKVARQINKARVVLKGEGRNINFSKLYSISAIKNVGVFRYFLLFIMDRLLLAKFYFLK